MKVCFLITTYGRKWSCQELVDSLQGLGDIFVLNDGDYYEIKRCNFYSQKPNQGKQGYWHTVNNLWSLPKKDYDYYFMIPDDFMPVPGFVDKTVAIWRSIKDPKKICINPYRDFIKRPMCWTNVEPEEFKYYRKTQWVDMCFMCEINFFKAVGKIPKINYDWKRFPRKSSGVGSYISNKLHRDKYSLYQTQESMFIATDENEISQMHR